MLSVHDSTRPVIRFGAFELELKTGELLKSGRLVRLSPQALRVLVLLVHAGGQLLTREELQNEVWGSTFVDFDHGLNRCIKQIRAALCDSADTPRYVETLRGRGYRFLMPVQKVDTVNAVQRGEPDETRRSLAVLRFKNLSGRPEEAWISTALSEMFTTELVGVSSLVRHVGQRTGARWVVNGAYTVVGKSADEHIRFDVRVQDTSSGDILVAFSETDALSNLHELVSRAGERLRRSLDPVSIKYAHNGHTI